MDEQQQIQAFLDREGFPEPPQREEAERLVGQSYRALHWSGDTGIEIKLARIEALQEPQDSIQGARKAPYCFRFEGTGDRALRDTFYKLMPADGKSLVLYLSCKGPLNDVVYYESIVN